MTPRMPSRAGCTWMLWVALMVAPSVAGADGAADSKRLSAAAAADFRAGSFAAAEEKWEAAYQAFPDANILYALGRCYAADNKPDRAAATLREFLEKSPRHARRAEVQKLIREQEVKIAAATASTPAAAPEPPPPEAPPPPPVVAPVAPVAAPAAREGEGGRWNRGLLKKWQLWAVVGGVVVVGAAVGLGVGLGLRGRDGFPEVGPGLSNSLVQF